MAADGLIVLGLDVSQTQANIQAELDSILNSTKTRKIILKTAIEKAETEKEIDAVVAKINKKTVKMGVEVDAKSVNSILAAQQKIASTQAKLNAQMKEYRDIAKDIGITLNKDTWNAFNHAVSSGDFTKANEILRSAKKQIEEYNAAVKKMNADTSVSRSVSSILTYTRFASGFVFRWFHHLWHVLRRDRLTFHRSPHPRARSCIPCRPRQNSCHWARTTHSHIRSSRQAKE